MRRVTSTDQYSQGLNASIAASRSQTSRSAALCTLPGDTSMHHVQVAQEATVHLQAMRISEASSPAM